MYSGTTFNNLRGTGKAQQLVDSIRADQRSEREQKFRKILEGMERTEVKFVAVLEKVGSLQTAAENAERVMEQAAHRLSMGMQHGAAMELLEAAKKLKTARGAV